MTRHMFAPFNKRFYLTPPAPCPYLPDLWERKVFTALDGEHKETVHEALMDQGFRRSQRIAYRPACPECAACRSARVPVARFCETKRWRRVLNRNADLVRHETPAKATLEQYDLLKRYLLSRHEFGGMADMDPGDYSAMVEETAVHTEIVEYRLPVGTGRGPLLAASLCDRLSDGASMVYSFFDPAEARRSLGAYMILDHIRTLRARGLPHLYLGYWVPGSQRMAYKAEFRPLEVLSGGIWMEWTDPEDAAISLPRQMAGSGARRSG